MKFDQTLLGDIESIAVTVIEELPDGTRVVSVFKSLEEVPEHLHPAFGLPGTREVKHAAATAAPLQAPSWSPGDCRVPSGSGAGGQIRLAW
jgi:hypothetical protein